MSNTGVKIFAQQAEQLYQRGVAAARGGQKTLAEKLLRQAVKLNPQHEQAWLWLSGVLHDPADVAFCLRAVLGINPSNERARRGLEWIEQQSGAAAAPQATAHFAPLPPAPATDSWWTSWRAAQTTWIWTIRALLLIPIVLISATLGVQAVIRAQPLPTFATARDIPIPTPLPTVAPPAPTSAVVPTATSHGEVLAYFEALAPERAALQQATDAYRATSDGGRTAVERATATKQLRDQVQRSRELIAGMTAPAEIAAAHTLYLEGLALEQEALDLLLEFYGSYDVALSNRAALRLQEARARIATATASWDAFAQQQGVSLPPAGAP